MNRFLRQVEPAPIPHFKRKALAAGTKAGRIFDLSQAVPSFPAFPAIIKGLRAALHDGETSFYTDVPGLPRLRELIAKRHPLASAIDPEQVLVTAGANHAMYTAMTLLLGAGDRVLLLEPYYFNYDMAAKMMGLKPVYFRPPEEAGFALKASDLIAFLEKNPVRAVLLVSPNNPTGTSYAPSELARLLRWTRPRGVEVILDETYAAFAEDHLRSKALASSLGRGLTLVGSFSKVFSLTGFRVGYLIASRKLAQDACNVQDTMIICAPHLSQLAAVHGLTRCASQARARVRQTRRLESALRKRCAGLKRFRLVSAGAFFGYLRHPFAGSAESAALRLFRGTGLLTLPGTVFGASQRAYLRLAFGNVGEAELEQAMDRLLEFDGKIAR